MRSLSRQLIAIKRPCLVIGNEIALRNDNGPGKDEGYEDKDKGLLQKGSIHALMVRGGALHLSPAPPHHSSGPWLPVRSTTLSCKSEWVSAQQNERAHGST